MNAQTEIASLQTEIDALEVKVRKVAPAVTLTDDEINQFILVLSQLVPDEEDFFSVFTSLEHLSQQTGFIITNYSIATTSSTEERLNIVVDGIGNAESFINFLKDYDVAGGRFITSDIIRYETTESSSVKIPLTFYSAKTSTVADEGSKLSIADVEMLREIRNKTSFVIKDTDEGDVEYPTKSNPF